MQELTIKDLLESGVHFGHQARRWNPKMKKFIFTERNGIYIIDLQKSLEQIKKACEAIREIAAKGHSVLFVGTKPQAAPIVKEEAERCGQYYVSSRWLGGMLTNYRTIRQSIKRLEHLEKMASDGTYDLITKKEVLVNEKYKEKLQLMLGGIREMTKLPGLLLVVDTKKEQIAVKEANRLGIPVCAIIDTNCDPEPIDYPIPGNDDAIRSIKVILSAITDSILEGMQMRVDEETISEKEYSEEVVGEGERIYEKDSASDLVGEGGGDKKKETAGALKDDARKKIRKKTEGDGIEAEKTAKGYFDKRRPERKESDKFPVTEKRPEKAPELKPEPKRTHEHREKEKKSDSAE